MSRCIMRRLTALAMVVVASGCTFYSGVQVKNNTDQTLRVYAINYTNEKEVLDGFPDNPEIAENMLATLKDPGIRYEEVVAEQGDPEGLIPSIKPREGRLTAGVWKQVVEPGEAGYLTTYCNPPSSRNCDRLAFLSDRPFGFLYQMDEILIFSQNDDLVARFHRSEIHPALSQITNPDRRDVPTLSVDQENVRIEWSPR